MKKFLALLMIFSIFFAPVLALAGDAIPAVQVDAAQQAVSEATANAEDSLEGLTLEDEDYYGEAIEIVDETDIVEEDAAENITVAKTEVSKDAEDTTDNLDEE